MKNLLFAMFLSSFMATCSFAQPNNRDHIDSGVVSVPSVRGAVLLSTQGTYVNRDGWIMYCGVDRQEFYRWQRTESEIKQCESYWKSITK